jgi:predicted ATPase
MSRIKRIHAKNYRCIRGATLELGDVSILFGPNGAGKSTWLDIVWFIRDCCIRGVPEAAADRNHGIGMLWSRAAEDEGIEITIETDYLSYTMVLGFEHGRINPYPAEELVNMPARETLFKRRSGSTAFTVGIEADTDHSLLEPEKPALIQFLAQSMHIPGVREFEHILRHIRFYDSRSAALFELRKYGSETDFKTVLWSPRGQNLWSVLRNLNDKRLLDDRYATIQRFMRLAFPDFKDLVIEATGPQSVYGSFIFNDARVPVMASGVSTGHLQMLLHLTALFSDASGYEPVILFDEPESSLHPHALAVLAKAFLEASCKNNRQVMIATHSPVLLSQFPADKIIAVEKDERGATSFKSVADIPGITELLDEYSIGSLFMAEALAPQSKLPVAATHD